MFARISFPISSFKTFTYKIPTSLYGSIQPGTCVNAPINKRLQTGFVVAISSDSMYKGKILNIDSVREKKLHLPKELWETLEWMSHYYITPLGQVLKAAVPHSFLKLYEPKNIQYITITPKGLKSISTFEDKKYAQKRLLVALSYNNEPVKIASLSEFSSSPYALCSQLEKEGLIEIIFQ